MSNLIINRVSNGPSTSTILLLRSSAVSFAVGENVEVVTNNPLVALNLSSDPKKSRISPEDTADLANVLTTFIDQNGQAAFIATVAGLSLNVDLVGLSQTGLEFV